MLNIYDLLVLTHLLVICSCSYIPPYYEGTPVDMGVTALEPPNFTGKPVYRVEFLLETEDRDTLDGFVHRTWEEFEEFQQHLDRDIFLNPDMTLPEDPTVENLNEYLQNGTESHRLMQSNLLHDFLGINWNGSDLYFFLNMKEFLKLVIPPLYRLPLFPPEPPIYDNEDEAIMVDETPFEVYVYAKAFRAGSDLENYLEFFNSFLNTCPDFENNGDDSDVQPPGTEVEIPSFFNQTFVHFLPGGYLNGHTNRISYLGKNKFNFLKEDLLVEWIQRLHGDKQLNRILDIGTGPGFSAFAYNQVFPDAEIVALDLAPPYIRFARRWQELRNVSQDNVVFYHGNGEDLSWLESDSFDLISYSYLLHEMPHENSQKIVNEMYRLLKPGGVMNGFEVPYPDTEIARIVYTEFNTWGHKWDEEGPKGPEPYMEEYELGLNLPKTLSDVGFKDVTQEDYSYFESIFLATK